MELTPTIDAVAAGFRTVQDGKASRHAPADRVQPAVWQYDRLILSALARDVSDLIRASGRGGAAVDIGCGKSPYGDLLESVGFEVRTLDVDRASGADVTGTAEDTTLATASVDLVICTQVLEHCSDPWRAVREMHRVLRPGGHAVISVPHVWFYHPHPQDNWRFTQEGLLRLMSDAGFEVTRLRSQGGSILAFAQITNFLVYGVAGRWGAPVYAMVNSIAPLADQLLPNPLFSLNFACLARRV